MLTARQFETAKPANARREIADGNGLYLIVQPSGAKSWAFRFRLNGKPLKLTLDARTLAEARQAARDAQDKLDAGKDPRNKTGGDGSVAALAEAYDRLYIAEVCRPGTQLAKRRSMSAIVAAWGNRLVTSITRKDAVALAQAVKPYTKNTYNERSKNIAAFLSWCVEQGEIEANPAARMKRLKVDSRDRILDDSEIALVWRKATEVNGRLGAMVKLLLLTGGRRDEIAALRWSEVKNDVISLSGKRTKTGVPYEIAITPAMRAVIEDCPRGDEFVLNGKFKVSLTSVTRKKLNPKNVAHWTLHDLRRTFASGCAKLGTAPHVIELCLNHHKASSVASIYNRHGYAAEMRAAWELWSNHVAEITR